MAQNYNYKSNSRRRRPNARLHDYSGPYQIHMLENSRHELLETIDSKDTVIWKRIRMMTGICENGERDQSFIGWGESSDEFSHADLPGHAGEQNSFSREKDCYLNELEKFSHDQNSRSDKLPAKSSATVTSADLGRKNLDNVNTAKAIEPYDDLPREIVSVTINIKSDEKCITLNNAKTSTGASKSSHSLVGSYAGEPTVKNSNNANSLNKSATVTSADSIIIIEDSENNESVTIPCLTVPKEGVAANKRTGNKVDTVSKCSNSPLSALHTCTRDETTCDIIPDICSSIKQENDLKGVFHSSISTHFNIQSPIVAEDSKKIKVEIKELNIKTEASQPLSNPNENCKIPKVETTEHLKIKTEAVQKQIRIDLQDIEEGEIIESDDYDDDCCIIDDNELDDNKDSVLILSDEQEDSDDDIKIITMAECDNNDSIIVIDPLELQGSISIGQNEDTSTDNDVVEVEKEYVAQKLDFVYKCDLCDTVNKDRSLMELHLKTDVHFSASSFFVDCDNQIIRIKDKKAVMNRDAMYKTKLVVCPLTSCSKIFSDVYACAYHYKSRHDQFSEPLYRLLNIMEEETFELPFEPVKCFECGKEFELKGKRKKTLNVRDLERRTRLLKHYVATGHSPFTVNPAYSSFFICPYCPPRKSIFTKLKEASNHAMRHKEKNMNGDQSVNKINIIHCDEGRVHKFALDIFEHNENKRKLDEPSGNEAAEKCFKTTIEVLTDSQENSNSDCVVVEDVGSDLPGHDSAPIIIESESRQSEAGLPSTSGSGVVAGCKNEAYVTTEGETDDLKDLGVRYKCDYCDILHDNQGNMDRHLKLSQHHSASSVLVSSNGTVKYMDAKMSVVCKEAAFKSVVAICPNRDCHQVYRDVHSCSVHFEQHPCSTFSSVSIYGVAKVVEEMEVKCPQKPLECQVCKKIFEKRVNLCDHCEKEIHLPFVSDKKEDVFYFCTYCEYGLHGFRQVMNHVARRHHKKVRYGQFTLKVIRVSRERVRRELPPYPKSKGYPFDDLRSEMKELEESRNICERVEKNKINRRIKIVKQLMKQPELIQKGSNS